MFLLMLIILQALFFRYNKRLVIINGYNDDTFNNKQEFCFILGETLCVSTIICVTYIELLVELIEKN